MLNRLSARYQKEIALSFIAVFFIAGLNTLKAEVFMSGRFLVLSDPGSYHQQNTSNKKNIPVNAGIGREMINNAGKQSFAGNEPGIPRLKKIEAYDGEIGGPSQPEMNQFKSIGVDNMVSPFSGDFSYNIPLMDVGGYPINMFYSSGITMDQEASWLGLGWNINPGTITRNMRGLPDDFDGTDIVTKRQSFRDDKTWGVTTGADIKFSGFPFVGFGLNAGVSFNNKLGVAVEAGTHASINLSSKAGDMKTVGLSFGASLSANSRSGASISPSVSLSLGNQKDVYGGLTGSIGVGYTYSSRVGLSSMHLDANANVGVFMNQEQVNDAGKTEKATAYGTIGGSFNSTLSFAYPSIMPSISRPFTRTSISINSSIGLEYWWVNPTFKLGGYYSRTFIAPGDNETKHPAFGMLYLQHSNDNNQALLDFNRANDGMYTPSSPDIGMPIYTYDVFSMTGEGTGGSFRAYRRDIGHMHDATVVTKEEQGAFGGDIGLGNIVHGGSELSYTYTPAEAGDWKTGNATGDVFKFKDNDETKQAAYFKNPNEKGIPDVNFQSSVANEDLVRLKLGDTHSPEPVLTPKLIRYDAGKHIIGDKTLTSDSRQVNREKRTQVISFLTAEESERIGVHPKIYSYMATGIYENKVILWNNCDKIGIDSFFRNDDGEHAYVPDNARVGDPPPPTSLSTGYRRHNHISEINVLTAEGKRYVYGLPVYNTRQVDVTFSVDNGQKNSDSRATYAIGDNTSGNTRGRDWIMDQQDMPAYPHSFLLTELLSPNYVDLSGDGLTDDDIGDGIKFNYSKYDDYKWRTPVGNNVDRVANYSEGLKTDDKDDKAHYIYGERESWYLYSVESKNMVARFYVRDDRDDGRSVVDDGGRVDDTKGMKKLWKISLFSKADITKYNDAAKPIKTVFFFQSQKLCKNVPTFTELGTNIKSNSGKLTLDSIWITYNGTTRKAKSRYVFYYPDDNNPNYAFNKTDRWGTYKPKSDNPPLTSLTNISNEDYPYSVQDETKANKNAAAWTMNKILLPSGAVISIDYESDSYAYVQNKKADCMFHVLGFGYNDNNPTSLPSSSDLDKIYTDDHENNIVFVQLPYPVTTDAEFRERYLADVGQLLVKLAVTMPNGGGLSGLAGYENISVYADIAGAGKIPGNDNVGWIRVIPLSNGHMPMAQGALQFLMQQLPGKAFKGYDVSEQDGAQAIVTALAGMIASVKGLVDGEFDVLKSDHKCSEAELNKTFVRLSAPTRIKYGGGLRVKSIVLNDNWKRMTDQIHSTYGQEYHYTTTEMINGEPATISSGVASWEPGVGGDENPFREISRFVDHNKGGPYDFGAIELPLGESFYPGASVGYSRVEVVSIHRGDTIKNPPTREVSEFYTNKDFPYKSMSTDLVGDARCTYNPPKIMQLLKIDLKKYITLSQGFLIETNDMCGKEKSHSVYTETNPARLISYTENFYNIKKETDNTYTFNHEFPTINGPDGAVSNSLIGRDIEVMTDFRQHTTESISTNITVNFDLSIWGFYPIPTGMVLAPTTKEKTMYRSAALLKVVNHYGMLDSVVVIDKGSMVTTKNLVYDGETGSVILTRTNNEHNKPVYNFNYPAHWAYSGMGPAYKNIDAIYKDLNFVHGILQGGTLQADHLTQVLESGDELYVLADNNTPLDLSLPCDVDASTNTPWTTLNKNEANRIWAVSTAKAGANPSVFVFMDAAGFPYNAKNADVRIIRSGKRNMLTQVVGSITSLNNPVVDNQLVFNDATGIVQTSVATFRDHWRVDNVFVKRVETVEVQNQALVHRKDIGPADFLTVNHDEYQGVNNDKWIDRGDFLNLYQATWGADGNDQGWQHTKKHKSAAFLLYDFNNIGLPTGTITYKAMLSLYSHTNLHFPNTPAYGYPSALHMTHSIHMDNFPVEHFGYSSQNDPNMLAEIHGLKKNWYSTADPDSWIDNYFSDPNAVSNGRGIIPYAYNGWEDYLIGSNSSINVTLPLITSVGSTLANQHEFGMRLRLPIFDYDPPHNDNLRLTYRCFWSPNTSRCYLTKTAPPIGGGGGEGGDGGGNGGGTGGSGGTTSGPSCTPDPFAAPTLSYYYYKWGDVTPQTEFSYDPTVNTLLTQHLYNTTGVFCRSKFTEQKGINPYVEGVLGNWRVDFTYVYYGERLEATMQDPVDLRTGGTIKNYQSFWNLAPNSNAFLTQNMDAANVWVWNSKITQYNRKGFEIENTDPLGRFNAGLYGYNQQLPVAVANNARVREIMFDGFEDYDYQAVPNCDICKTRHAFKYEPALTSQQIDATEKHSGKYSMKVDGGQSIVLTAPVTNEVTANAPYAIDIKPSTTSYTNVTLTTGGTGGSGLRADFYNHAYSSPAIVTLEPASSSTSALVYTYPTIGIGLPLLNGVSAAPGVSPEYFSAKWSGILQAPETGWYYFKSIADNGYRLKVDNHQLSSDNAWYNQTNTNENSAGIQLLEGHTYSIEVSYFNNWGPYQFDLKWKHGTMNNFIPIPLDNLYPPGSTSFHTSTQTSLTCNRLDGAQVTGNALTDTFSLLQGKRMLLSAWVKANTNDCHCASYETYASVYVSDDASSSPVAMHPVGGIIEGWQRVESAFTVNTTASAMTIEFKSENSSVPIWFDDVRILPYNANLKSFVYHPSNLRLMAELDENNYASFYEYDDDGTLTRVKKETIQGIKTITETRSATQKSITPDNN